MEKRTILAVVLSIGVFIVWMIIQSAFFPSQENQIQPQTVSTHETKIEETKSLSVSNLISPSLDDKAMEEQKIIFTNVYKAVFESKGAVLSSLQLLDPKFVESDGQPIDMIFNDDTNLYPFSIKFGSYDTSKDNFEINDISNNSISFSKSYSYKKNDETINFILIKSFTINDDYSIVFNISIETEDKVDLPLNFDNIMYSLYYGPQIGPKFETLDLSAKTESRNYTYFKGDRKDYTAEVEKYNGDVLIKDRLDWAAIEGKYFISIVYPHNDANIPNTIAFNNDAISSLPSTSSIIINRPYKSIYKIDESYFFYVGPKRSEDLAVFAARSFDKAIPGDFWGWLIAPLKFILNLLYGLVNNYGVAIILLTLLIKIVFFPLTQKSFKSTAKMSQLTPKINELKEKYKDNPQKMNAEMAELYKTEGINPLSGCLPWLIQLPIFLAFYGMLNSHFDLRGAEFIPGWINDLSAPDSILQFSSPLSILIINIPAIRLLPIIMLGVSVIQQIFLQNPAGQTSQTKMLMYSMPIVFFFILYNMPSGLVLYWTMQNIFSAIQQIYNNYSMKKQPSVSENKISKFKR